MASAFALKALFTISNFALVTLAARTLGLEVFGNYSLLFSAAGLLSIVATFGQQVLVMRFWSEYVAGGRCDLLKGSLLFSGAVCLTGCVLVGLPFYVWCTLAYSSSIGAAVTLYLVTVSLVMTTSHLIRTAVGIEAGDGFGNLLLTIPAISYLGYCLAAQREAELAALFGVMAAGGAAGLLIHLRLLCRSLNEKFPGFWRTRPAFDLSRWLARSTKLWASNGLEASNQYLDVLVVGALLDPAAAGAYFVVTRVANILSVATDAIHMFSTRHIPDLYYHRELTQLDALLDMVARVTIAVIIGGLLTIAAGGSQLLAIFNGAYAPFHGALLILSFGAASIAAAGPSASLLMLTGHEGRYLAVVGGSVLLRVVGLFVLLPHFGLTGGAIATTAALLAMALVLRHSAKDWTGIEGSVLRLIGQFRRDDKVRMAD
ncbi:lipopolysaccharide biosynthesis protein [Bradyrhizobium sp. LHD-71]|uniref:lipopolysaccharide biosynthesis protein n=1 Tax=Bradyrhizobium sp. LHD-71 TaxID=3072141 RepID=UPI00280FA85C|nr:lipopolysaccharide biosynthesis protein [Bradyrhizobium sp. LHD-71]MDQ8726661.1 lipopolysaccharide biosynthesis protein [Bradyrhizobium sp. LHD-71]